jgi:AraC-like DNA-binding protein
MPLLFNSDRQQTTFYRNPISVNDLNSAILVESREAIPLDNADMVFENWCFGGFRLAHSVLGQQQATSFDIKNDIDAVKIYFNRKGRTHINYRQLSKSFLLQSGQCNMLYSAELDSRMSHIGNHSDMFSLQITRECFLDLAGEGDIAFGQFGDKASRRQPALFSGKWLSMTAAMEKCIGEILHCPFERGMKKIYLRSKAVELFILFADSGGERRGVRHSRVKNPSDREKLYFARDYLVQNYANPHSLSALVKISGLNEFKLKSGFRELFGASVMDFLIHYRLEQARELLLNTEKNVSEVAYETGYASPAYFGKAFKKKFGFPPKNV